MKKRPRYFIFALAFILAGLLLLMFMLAIVEMPPYGQLGNPTHNQVWERYVWKGVTESGGLNMVTNIILDYRGYDTLLETTVLFTAVMAIMLTLGAGKSQKK